MDLMHQEAEGMDNKRKWPRVDFTVHATMDVDGESIEVGCRNLSMNGMLVSSPKSLPLGTSGRVRILHVMGRESLLVLANFKIIRSDEGQSHGFNTMGLTLFDIDGDSSINLFNIVRHNTPDNVS
ncbi:MAG: PilZ domain-containing protein [Desulfatibacillum sp.]|nr:PilZ domain-containing protein [Desulfatibacillum sp.]